MSGPAETTRAAETPSRDETSQYRSLLATGERVLLVRQRHWLTFLEAGRWFVFALGAGIAAAAVNDAIPDDSLVDFLETFLDWVVWICLVIGILGVIWNFLAWKVERYLVTTRRVVEAGGLVNKYTKDTSLQAISDMVVGHPWLGRIAGYGEIDLLTASDAGTSKIRFLPDADGFKRALLDAKHELELEVGGARVVQEAVTAATAPPAEAQGDTQAPAALSTDELDVALSRLADMRDRGLITPEEFEAKKRELLARL
jgi:hypothetical protein